MWVSVRNLLHPVCLFLVSSFKENYPRGNGLHCRKTLALLSAVYEFEPSL